MNKGLNRFAILVAGATFCLIIAGALVTSNDAGLATSDWPLSNGQLFPRMVGNLFWEHTPDGRDYSWFVDHRIDGLHPCQGEAQLGSQAEHCGARWCYRSR